MNYYIYLWSEQQYHIAETTEMAISDRLRAALKRIKANNLTDIVQYTEADLKALKFSKGEIKELTDMLRDDFHIELPNV
jgi:hypothetical protein